MFGSDVTVTTTNPSDSLTLAGNGGGSFALSTSGPGLLNLAGNYTLGDAAFDDPGLGLSSGTCTILGSTTVADGNTNSFSGGATLNITGTLNSGGADQVIGTGTVNLMQSGVWNLRGGGAFVVGQGGNGAGDNATLNILNSATLNINRTVGLQGANAPGGLVIAEGFGNCAGIVNQAGGVVIATQFNNAVALSGNGYGPGIILGGLVCLGYPNQVQATYNLSGGTLVTSAVFNMCGGTNSSGQWVLQSPGNFDQVAIFNFNGGILRASQSDSADPEAIAEGLDHFMGNLTHAYVQAGGAVIDTNGFNISINQPLEHDPSLGASLDGGLQKLGSGNLTLLQSGSFTGTTQVQGGTLTLADPNALQFSTLNTVGTGTISFGTLSTATLGGLSGPGNTNWAGTVALVVGNNDSNTTFSGSITTVLAGLTKTGSGSLTIDGALQSAGPLVVDAGTLVLAGSDLFLGGTIDLDGVLTIASNEAMAAGTSLSVGAGGVMIFDPTAGGMPVADQITPKSTIHTVPEPGSIALLVAIVVAAWSSSVLGGWIRRSCAVTRKLIAEKEKSGQIVDFKNPI